MCGGDKACEIIYVLSVRREEREKKRYVFMFSISFIFSDIK